MMRILKIILVCLFLSASSGYAEEPDVHTSANSVAEMMRQARYSDGFEARMNVLVTKANGAHLAPFKLAVVGQSTADKQRLVIRGISPDSVRDHYFAAVRDNDGGIRTVKYRGKSASEYNEIDPASAMFDSGLVAWDMFSPWWGWVKHSLAGKEQINGRECIKIRSFAADKTGAVSEVESCVDQQAKLSLRTRLFDSGHILMRTMTVGQVMRKGKDGVLAAKKLTITDVGNVRTEIEIYAGDEEYQISAETFALLDHLTEVRGGEIR